MIASSSMCGRRSPDTRKCSCLPQVPARRQPSSPHQQHVYPPEDISRPEFIPFRVGSEPKLKDMRYQQGLAGSVSQTSESSTKIIETGEIPFAEVHHTIAMPVLPEEESLRALRTDGAEQQTKNSPTSTHRAPEEGYPDCDSPNAKLIFSSDFSDLKDTILDLNPTATSCRYRLMNMTAFLNSRRLMIYEFADFPNTHGAHYSAVSYVWRGNPLIADASSPSYWSEEFGTFSVKGAEDGDPISLDVLYHVCTAVLSCSYSGSYLWLDRLCILQSDQEDKSWQIKQMHEIYRYCKICCILPGGIQRLVCLDEETAWIDRAWTLQEALLPHRTIALFMADEDRLEELEKARQATAIHCPTTDVIPGLSAFGELRPMLELSLSTAVDSSPISIFGRKRAPRAALFGAVVKQNTHSYIERDLKEQMIWRCALMRTSSRPVDMVFSIMGLFSVTLDPLQFGKNDRLQATIALASRVSSIVGSKASWLAAAYQLDPCRQLSTFPQFPETSVEGNAYYGITSPASRSKSKAMLVADVIEERCDVDRWLSGLPEGQMDEHGYFTFSSKVVHLVPASMDTSLLDRPLSHTNNPLFYGKPDKVLFRAEDGSAWWLSNDAEHAQNPSISHTLAVYLGKQESYVDMGRSHETVKAFVDDDSIDWRERYALARKQLPEIALLVQEHSPGKFHRISYLKLNDRFYDTVQSFSMTTVSVGGPDVL